MSGTSVRTLKVDNSSRLKNGYQMEVYTLVDIGIES